MKDDIGEWVEDDSKLIDIAFFFYKNLFSMDMFQFRGFPINNCFPSLTNQVKLEIRAPITKEEIKKALFSIGPLKTLGSNGFHVIFFQS